MKRKNNLLPLLAVAVAVVVVFALFLLPLGGEVRVVAQVSENTVVITKCGIQTLHPISSLDPDNTVSIGNNIVVLKVLNGQTQIFSSNRTNIGIGTCVIESTKLPSDLSSNSLLTIIIELRDSQGNLLNQDQTTINYR